MALVVVEYVSEQEKISDWRLRCLLEAGMKNRVLAEQLANCEADLHVMITVKKQGCSDKLLGKIFL